MAKANPATISNRRLLNKLEKLIGTDLPPEYRTFMLNFDGELPQNRSFKLGRDEWVDLRKLWPLKGRYVSVAGGLGLLEGDEAHLLVVGDDGLGDWICLAFRGRDRGKVFFIDHEYSPGKRGRIVRVAPHFEAFMKGLKPSVG